MRSISSFKKNAIAYEGLRIIGLLILISSIHSKVVASTHNYQELHGMLVIEAEHFAAQHLDSKRRWMVFSQNSAPHNYADSDTLHYENASGGQYIEILPDTRTNHFEPLARGENFSNVPGAVAVLSYPVYFETAGKYYIWARAYSSGSEDNGVHFGINGTWPNSAQRLQLCDGKHQWTWSSAQRTASNHCGTPNTVYLEISQPGLHNIMVSMREDGFELDKFLLTKDEAFVPKGIDAEATLSTPPDFPEKTMLLGIRDYSRIFFASSDFTARSSNKVPLYPLERQQALAINTADMAHLNIFGYAQTQIDRRDAGRRKLTLVALSYGGDSANYKVLLNDKEIGSFSSQTSTGNLQEQYFDISAVDLAQGDILTVASMAVTKANQTDAENSNVGGLWRALVLSRE